jgi:GTP pyrophosphokinase
VRKKKPGSGVSVKGVDDILIKFGKCCQPVPGDSITGYITQGFGVTVHRTSCVNALKMNPERQIEVEWNTDNVETYSVKIQVTSYDRVGLLADITSVISKNEANILGVNTKILDNKTVDGCFTISVKDTVQLKKVISDLKKIKLVHHVRRLDG